MKASLSWLKTYVPIEMGASELADALTMVGLEVESATDRFDFMKGILVGRVTEVRPHPNADKLRICDVDAGGRRLKVICGAPNVQKGMLSAVALPGIRFPNGTVLRESSIRGVVSEGMLCSEKELGLGDDASGILKLDASLKLGQELAQGLKLSDTVFEIGVTPNRPDCLGMIGIAREIAGIQRSRITYPDVRIDEDEDQISTMASVTIEAPEHCPRYAARLVFDVSIGPSPFWLQDRLFSIGLRPINNIVDITNFILMETGQPLHAFDFDRLAQHRIVVKTAKEGTRFITLDQKERILSSDTLMICDGEKEVAIAGVMGGMNSEITEKTTRVLIESACFDPVSIRRTAKRLGVSTEASHRFERGVDPEGVIFALNRAARLMTELGGGRIVSGWIDACPKEISKREVPLSLSRTNHLLGTGFTQEKLKTLLESIEFRVTPIDEDRLQVLAPSFRVDVKRPEDLMEEVARLSGYQHIPVTFPSIPPVQRRRNPSFWIRDVIRRWMAGFGFLEAINYSFIHSRFDDHLGLPENDFRRKTVRIINPISDEQSRMRTTLIPGLLGSLQRNLAQQFRSLRLFETGKVYLPQNSDDLPQETEMLAVLWTGFRFEPGWYGKETPCDFFDIKGTVEGLGKAIGIRTIEVAPMPDDFCAYLKPHRSAMVRTENQDIGWMGEMRPEALTPYDIHQEVFIAELNLDALLPFMTLHKKAEPISRFPAATRDFTLIVDKRVRAGEILQCVASAGEKWIETIRLFDVFEKDPIPAGKKSISFRITYRSQNRTLEDQEVTQVHQKISDMLLNAFDASLPE
jgi:phenylalanyl-tRNA synthetase beta chain